jgi:ferredoxin-NADP reductase
VPMASSKNHSSLNSLFRIDRNSSNTNPLTKRRRRRMRTLHLIIAIMTSAVASSEVLLETPAWKEGVPTKLIRKTTLVEESPDHLPVHTLTFEIPTGFTFTGKAQSHSQVKIDMGDVVKMVIPNYKPKSYSMSALRETEFDVTVKVYPNGRASGFLDRLNIGDCIHSFGMRAEKIRNPGDFVGVIAFGVGITEGLPVSRAELEKGDAKEVVLLWASRTSADTFWNEEIEDLLQTYRDRFRVVRILSREKKDDCLFGRINPEVLRKVFGENLNSCNSALEPNKRARFLPVGTKEMMNQTNQMLEEALSSEDNSNEQTETLELLLKKSKK